MIKLLLSVAIGIGSVSQGAVIRWDFQNAVFDDGGQVNGVFFVDNTTQQFIGWDIVTLSGTRLAGAAYQPANSTLTLGNGCDLRFAGTSELCLRLNEPLFAPGIYRDLLTTTSESSFSGTRYIVQGGLLDDVIDPGVAVPEPATLSIVLLGATGLTVFVRRRHAFGKSS